MTDAIANRILYVEDEPDIRTIAKIALEKIGGFTVRVCGSGREALDAVSGFAPDCVILDVMMPGMDGPSTLAALRALPASANVPVIFMTAKVQSSEIAQYKALGALDVIVKPFDPLSLASTIRNILGQAAAGRVPAALLEQLRQLRQGVSQELPSRIEKIETAWRSLAGRRWDAKAAANLRALLHSMVGTAGTFGFKQTSLVARSAGSKLVALLATSGAPTHERLEEMTESIIALSRVAASEQPNR